jgi:hypothetical protein
VLRDRQLLIYAHVARYLHMCHLHQLSINNLQVHNHISQPPPFLLFLFPLYTRPMGTRTPFLNSLLKPIRILHVLRSSSPLDILAQPDIITLSSVPVHSTHVTRRIRRQLVQVDSGSSSGSGRMIRLVRAGCVIPRAVRDQGQVGAHICRGEDEAPVLVGKRGWYFGCCRGRGGQHR